MWNGWQACTTRTRVDHLDVKPSLKLWFSDFWFGFDPENNFFTNLLRTRFRVTIDPRADLLICSVFGEDWREFQGKRLFFTGEFIPPEVKFFDYSFSFAPPSETNYYLPLYRIYGDYPRLFTPRTVTEEEWSSKRPIATVFSNRACSFRNWTFHRLNKDVGVGSGGRAYNNVGGPVENKRDFLANYRFSLAFENSSWPGYTTEKLVEAYCSRTVPLYWGDSSIHQVFNSRAFLSLRGKADYPRFLESIREASTNYEAYRLLFEAPLFPENREPSFLKEDSILDFMDRAIAASGRLETSFVSDLSVFRWHTWWRFREWGANRLFWIRLFQSLSWVGYELQRVKKFVKRVLRR